MTGGSSLLWGGNSSATDGITEAFQTVDVSGSAASIDAGRATAGLSAYLGGGLAFNDRTAARAEFLGDAGGTLAAFEIGPVTAADRNNLTTLLRRQGSAPVPAGTRRIRVTLTSTDDDKTYSGAVADNVKLTLDAPTPPPPPAQAFGPDTRVTLKLAARRIRAKGPVKVRVTNGNPFEVTGSLGARRRQVRLRAARLQLAANTTVVTRLTLTRSLRRQLRSTHRLVLRLTARVHDPAGNTRTVRGRAGLRLVRSAGGLV